MPAFGPSLVSPTQSSSQQNPPSPPFEPAGNPDSSIYAHQKWSSSGHGPQLNLARLPTVIPANDASSSSSRSVELGIPRPKRKRITPEQLEVLSNLFEYTDTPTFDLREGIGAKLGMSNREVQVWFQNRRAKVNRQRPSANGQPLHERSLPSTSQPSPSQQDSNRTSHHRLINSSSSEHLLPGVSSILNSSCGNSSSPTYSTASLLPPFQPTGSGVNNAIHDAYPHRSTSNYPQRGTGSSSPLDAFGCDRRIKSEPQLRHSPSLSRRRTPLSTPGFPYPRTWHPRRSGEPDHENHVLARSPRRASADPQMEMVLNHTTRPRWSSSYPSSSHSLIESQKTFQISQSPYSSRGSTKVGYWSQSYPTINDSAVHYRTRDFATSKKDKTSTVEPEDYQSHIVLPKHPSPCISASSSRSASPQRNLLRRNHTRWNYCGGGRPPTAIISNNTKEEEGRGLDSIETSPHALTLNQTRPSSPVEEPVRGTTRSLFPGRRLPPLPTPMHPGPGSFPPPVTLIATVKKQKIPPGPTPGTGTNAGCEFKLPPLL